MINKGVLVMHANSAAVVDRTRNAVALHPRLLSLRETIVLAGIAEREKDVRNDIMHGVLPAANVIRLENSRLCFHWPYVLTFAAVYGNRFLDSAELRRVALEKVFILATGCCNGDHAAYNLAVAHSAAFTGTNWCRIIEDCDLTRKRIHIDNYLDINVGKACEDVKPRVNLYAHGLERVEENSSVLGGAAVFRDTRLSVLHIGRMAERGVSINEILEDYPGLTEDDVKFAKLYFRARPPIGRPRDGAHKNVEHCE
jgi:uncharacterized protein (DUF433 family)